MYPINGGNTTFRFRKWLKNNLLSLPLNAFLVTDNPGAWFLHWCVIDFRVSVVMLIVFFSFSVILIGISRLVLRSYSLRHQKTMLRAQHPKSLLKIGKTSVPSSTNLLLLTSSCIQVIWLLCIIKSDSNYLVELFCYLKHEALT